MCRLLSQVRARLHGNAVLRPRRPPPPALHLPLHHGAHLLAGHGQHQKATEAPPGQEQGQLGHRRGHDRSDVPAADLLPAGRRQAQLEVQREGVAEKIEESLHAPHGKLLNFEAATVSRFSGAHCLSLDVSTHFFSRFERHSVELDHCRGSDWYMTDKELTFEDQWTVVMIFQFLLVYSAHEFGPHREDPRLCEMLKVCYWLLWVRLCNFCYSFSKHLGVLLMPLYLYLWIGDMIATEFCLHGCFSKCNLKLLVVLTIMPIHKHLLAINASTFAFWIEFSQSTALTYPNLNIPSPILGIQITSSHLTLDVCSVDERYCAIHIVWYRDRNPGQNLLQQPRRHAWRHWRQRDKDDDVNYPYETYFCII